MANAFSNKLAVLSAQNKRRTLSAPGGIDFSSNDYLGLANHAGIRQAMVRSLQNGVPLGSGGSRLLRGNHPQHEDLEAFAADFFGTEAALFMSTGYLANLAVLTTLPGRGDIIVFDAYIHASTKEGLHAASARHMKFTHNDAQACEDAVKRARAQGADKIWIAVESVYSMDGDLAPLADIMDIADRFDAYVIVDEAHATGIHGPDGRGLSCAFEGRPNLISVHTCGKALGQSGALVTLSAQLKDYIINTARSFIYTTAPPPLAAVAVQAALQVVRDEPERRRALLDLIQYAHRVFPHVPGATQILPLIIGDDGAALAVAEGLQSLGFDIRAIRTPTVPKNRARLRMSITLNSTAQDIDALVLAFNA